MARGDFLGSFARGIYGEMNNQQQLQEQKDYQSKQGLIQMLTGLADKVEPQSLPLLMGHIWDTMGIKQKSGGKGLRGFLDAFSGMPNRSVEDQLGSKFRELTKGFVGPQEAQGVRLRSNISQKGIPGLVGAAPTSEYGQKAAADLKDLGNKMVFKDPYQQDLGKIQARYEAQFLAQQQRQEDAHNNAINRLNISHQNDLDRDRQKNEQTINRAVEEMARSHINDEDILQYHPSQRLDAARQKARSILSKNDTLKTENLEQNVEVKKSVVEKNKRDLTGQGSPATQISRQRLGHTVAMDRGKIQESHDQADVKVTTLTSQVEEAGKALDEFAKNMAGMSREKLATSYMAGMGGGPVVKAIQKYNNLQKELKAAIQERATRRKQLDDYDKTQGGTQPAAPAPGKGKKPAVRPVLPGKNAVGPVTSNPTGGGMYDATTPTNKSGSTYQKTYKIREDSLNKVLPTLKGNWVVGETITEDGVRKVIVRLQE